MMSRRLTKRSKRFREAREQVAHDKVIPTQGSGSSFLSRASGGSKRSSKNRDGSKGGSPRDLEMAPTR